VCVRVCVCVCALCAGVYVRVYLYVCEYVCACVWAGIVLSHTDLVQACAQAHMQAQSLIRAFNIAHQPASSSPTVCTACLQDVRSKQSTPLQAAQEQCLLMRTMAAPPHLLIMAWLLLMCSVRVTMHTRSMRIASCGKHT